MRAIQQPSRSSSLLFAVFSQTQNTGRIARTVRDGQSAVIAGAEVAVEDPAIGERCTAHSDEAGNYSIAFLAPGSYEIKIRAKQTDLHRYCFEMSQSSQARRDCKRGSARLAPRLPTTMPLGRNSPNVSVNGSRVTQNGYRVNGVDATDISLHMFADVAVPAPESVSEVKVQTSMYDASVSPENGVLPDESMAHTE